MTSIAKTSLSGRAFIEANEARKYVAYQDDAGVWTNGIGHTGKDVFPGQHVNDEQVDRWFENDLAPDELTVRTAVKVELDQEEFDAMVDFCFNVGTEAFKTSTLVRVLNQGRYDLVPEQLLRWVNITDPKTGEKVRDEGLVNRRMKEIHLFQSGQVPDHIAALPVSNVVPDPVPPKHAANSKTLWAQGVALVGVLVNFLHKMAQVVLDNAHDLGESFQGVADKLSGLIQYSDKVKYIFLAASGVAIGFTWVERMRKLREGQ